MIAMATPTQATRLTYADLERQKAEWLVEGMTVIEDLMTVVREMGTPVVERSRYLIRFDEGNIHATYYDHAGSYLTAHITDDGKFIPGAFSRTTAVVVWIDADKQVCSLTVTNDPYHAKNARDWNIFRPGNWQRVLLAHLAEAKQKAANREALQTEQKRRELEQRLLIGQTV